MRTSNRQMKRLMIMISLNVAYSTAELMIGLFTRVFACKRLRDYEKYIRGQQHKRGQARSIEISDMANTSFHEWFNARVAKLDPSEVTEDSRYLSQERLVRGPTKMADVWNLSPDLSSGRQIEVRFNTKGQPIGYEKRVLTSCLGTLARNCYLLPLSYRSWRKMPQMFKTDVLKRIERMINAVEPNSVELFVMTRQYKYGSFVDKAAENAAKELNALMSEGSSNVDEIFVQVMGKEHPDRVRVVKLREKLEVMTNKVAVLEEKADKVSELEVSDASSSMAPQRMNKKAHTYMEEPGMSSL
ncbi:Transposase, Ptta/En/Spm, plant [Corchorus capsularis]|uniref:Transposase, Ptta/En/Spm, plant n=1 Tax=Corchorus capsularis TaxID=210143 RepID=A0A1R3HIE2_COCAP|nr:Transposase, Ptta/En/Spm, plant [Corchorus capsularis]